MNQSDFLKEILIVIVLYKMEANQSLAFRTVEVATAPWVSSTTVLVYDNSPYPNFIGASNVIYKHSPENKGVSGAYNDAASIALELNKKWMLLLDQDSEITPYTFAAYHTAVLKNINQHLFVPIMKDRIGIVSPFVLRHGKGYRLKKLEAGVYSLQNFKAINSGMLISIEAFHKSGGFDERFPLDLSDIVFLDRLKLHYPKFVLIDETCNHSLSAHDNTVEEALKRFKIFCNAMLLYKHLSQEKIWIKAILLARSLKLYFRYREFKFLRIGMNI